VVRTREKVKKIEGKGQKKRLISLFVSNQDSVQGIARG